MSRRRGSRGLLFVGLVFFAFLIVVDLFRTDSAILGFLDEAPEVGQPQESRDQRVLRVLFGGSRARR